MSRKHLLPTRDHVHSVSLWIFSLTRTPLYYLCIMTAWLFSTIATTACVLAISVVVGFIKPSHHTIFRGFQMTHLSRQILTCEQLINWILKTLIQWLVNAKEKPYTHFQLADTSFQQVNLGKGARRGRSTPTCFPKETQGQAPAVDPLPWAFGPKRQVAGHGNKIDNTGFFSYFETISLVWLAFTFLHFYLSWMRSTKIFFNRSCAGTITATTAKPRWTHTYQHFSMGRTLNMPTAMLLGKYNPQSARHSCQTAVS